MIWKKFLFVGVVIFVVLSNVVVIFAVFPIKNKEIDSPSVKEGRHIKRI